ncbi:3679_t:CDS:2 [Funneliformis mosseae]|uniref:3679_t:CDS:1 n=2 Tax=Funneliformis TaxID=1117308 RepID=A0A9N9CE37_FUNMO|nr:3679_t:CDS:2 [Funneliformis mosseae]
MVYGYNSSYFSLNKIDCKAEIKKVHEKMLRWINEEGGSIDPFAHKTSSDGIELLHESAILFLLEIKNEIATGVVICSALGSK